MARRHPTTKEEWRGNGEDVERANCRGAGRTSLLRLVLQLFGSDVGFSGRQRITAFGDGEMEASGGAQGPGTLPFFVCERCILMDRFAGHCSRLGPRRSDRLHQQHERALQLHRRHRDPVPSPQVLGRVGRQVHQHPRRPPRRLVVPLSGMFCPWTATPMEGVLGVMLGSSNKGATEAQLAWDASTCLELFCGTERFRVLIFISSATIHSPSLLRWRRGFRVTDQHLEGVNVAQRLVAHSSGIESCVGGPLMAPLCIISLCAVDIGIERGGQAPACHFSSSWLMHGRALTQWSVVT